MILTDRQRWVKTIHALANGGVKNEVSTQLPDVIIPARNEERTIGQVVSACIESGAIGRVIVVDNDSTDDTALIAKESGAKAASNSRQPKDVLVVPCPYIGKGQAVTTGLRHVTSDRLILIDADLINVKPEHIKLIAEDTVGMVCWVVDNDQIPELAQAGKGGSGTRSMPTSLARTTQLVGYGMEKALNYAAVSQLIPLIYRDMPDVCQSWVPYFAEHKRLPDWAKEHALASHFNR